MAKISLLTAKSETGFQRFFFSHDTTSLKDELKRGCLSDFNQDALRELVECNPYKST